MNVVFLGEFETWEYLEAKRELETEAVIEGLA